MKHQAKNHSKSLCFPSLGSEDSCTEKPSSFKNKRLHLNSEILPCAAAYEGNCGVERPLTCGHCGKSYKQEKAFLNHQSVCVRPRPNGEGKALKEDGPLTKNQITHAFKTKSTLGRHHQIHIKGKPYKCTICGKHKCSFCTKAFRTPSALRRHQQLHKEGKPYICNICGKAFAYRYNLTHHREIHVEGHKRIHTETRSYQCPTCRKAFGTKYSLWRHQEMHVKEDPDSLLGGNETGDDLVKDQASGSDDSVDKQAAHSVHAQCQEVHQERKPPEGSENTSSSLLPDHQSSRVEESAIKQSDSQTFRSVGLGVKGQDRPIKVEPQQWTNGSVYPGQGIQTEEGPPGSPENGDTSLGHSANRAIKDPADWCFLGKLPGVESMPETEKKKDSTALVSGSTRSLKIGLTRQQQDQVNLHKCKFCGKCLRFKSLLVDHERMHREARPYKCSQCSKSFLHKAILMSHMMTHMKQASRKHPKNGKSLTVKSALVDSEISHERGSPTKCPVSRKIITRSSYRLWCPRKWAQKTPHQCQYCGKCLSTRIILADHEKLHTGERPYKCHKCTESFIRKPHLFRHLEIHLRELSNEDVKSLRIKRHHYGQKASEGLLPASDVSRRSGLAKHPKIPTQENYVCQHCGKRMRTKSAFVNHGKIHRRKQQPYSHLEREGNTSQEGPLIPHQETHTGGKLSLCSDSKDKMAGRHSVELQTAILRKLQCSPSKGTTICDQQMKHVCSRCKKSFRSRTNLLIHEKNHTENRPFPCTQCKKSFFSVTALKVHMRIHSGEKPFKCSECDFRCNALCNLNRHKATHSQKRLHRCMNCGKSFWLNPKHMTHLKFSGKEKAYACPGCEQASVHTDLLKMLHFEREAEDMHNLNKDIGMRSPWVLFWP
uniref:C2H2-type domain-containing protein n=1 Tax=Naja naja TaxID=35670 RepID=A0A8C6VI24_NAJNA